MIAFTTYIFMVEPKNINEALEDADWIVAMQEELNQFEISKVWHLVPRPEGKTVIGTRWLFRNKLDYQGNITRNKLRLVVQGYNQEEDIDYDRHLLHLQEWRQLECLLPLHPTCGFKFYQMDAKSAFLNGYLKEKVFAPTSRF